MRRGFLLVVSLIVGVVLGCGQRQPYLRPPLEAPLLNPPPDAPRYDSPNLPEQILTPQDDFNKRKSKEKELNDPSKNGGNMGMGGPGGKGM